MRVGALEMIDSAPQKNVDKLAGMCYYIITPRERGLQLNDDSRDLQVRSGRA